MTTFQIALASFLSGAAIASAVWWRMVQPVKPMSDAEWERRYREKHPYEPPSALSITDDEELIKARMRGGERL